MTGAPFSHQQHYPQATQFRVRRIVLLLLCVGTVLIGGTMWLLKTQARPIGALMTSEATAWPAWMRQAQSYPPPEEPKVPAVAPKRDETAEMYAAIRQQLELQRQAIEELKRRPFPTMPQPPKPAATPVPPKPHAPMLFVSHDLPHETQSAVPLHTLAPGATKIPCVVETRINSDVESLFTVRTTTNVWDTATGRNLLIPQGSTILGKYQSAGLLYGNQRLPMLSTTLAFPNGKSLVIDETPVLDQQGTAGLVSYVNNHWWRNLGAVVIQGVLRGGAQAVMLNAGTGGANVAGALGAGVAGSTSQQGQQILTRFIDTRPTIAVDAGEQCTIILAKPLQLPAFF